MYSQFDNIHDFLAEYSKRYADIEIDERNIKGLEHVRLSQSELIYVIDFTSNGISFAKGFKEFLGFDDKLMTLEKYMDQMHPEDIDLVSRIGKATILHTSDNLKDNINDVLYISFRIKNKEGNYLKVLSQSSVFELDKNGNMISSLVKVSDLSFMGENEVVKYKLLAVNLDEEKFRKEIFGANYDLFTPRELEIIQEIEKGLTNIEIGTLLEISKHTVASHRKKIMKKSECRSRDELLKFCRRNGVLQ